jgi:Fe-S-cluster containining protein
VPLPQILSSSTCLSCQVCCRFPDADSPYRPCCTGLEIAALVARGHDLETTWGLPVPEDGGGPGCGAHVALAPDAGGGTGHHCPFLEESTHRCEAYGARPLDCQLYPLMLVLGEGGDHVVLHLDAHCPHGDRYLAHDSIVATVVQEVEARAGNLAACPNLVADQVDELRAVAELPRLSAALGLGGAGRLRRLRLQDRDLVEAAARVGVGDRVLSPRGFAPLYLHRERHHLLVGQTGEHTVLLALDGEAPWVPVAPLGPPLDHACLAYVEETVRTLGGGATLHLPAIRQEDLPVLQARGYEVRQEGAVVLASRDQVAALRGRRFRAHRNLVNRAQRSGVRVRPVTPDDTRAVLRLWGRWWNARPGRQEDDGCSLELGRLLGLESLGRLRRALQEREALDLVALVAELEGEVVGFTAGAPLPGSTLAVLFELGEAAPPGVAQLLARELARAAHPREILDLMDDTGRRGVALAKGRYGVPHHLHGALLTGRPDRG